MIFNKIHNQKEYYSNIRKNIYEQLYKLCFITNFYHLCFIKNLFKQNNSI